jgi:hypothetical protein
MKLTWKIRDLIDLEYFLDVDDNSDDDAVVRRDREIYLNEVLPVLEKDGSPEAADRKTIIRLWFESRRRIAKDSAGKETLLPGKLFGDSFRLLLVLFLVTGIIVGTGMAFTFLEYSGTTPVNVSVYFGVFVVFQIVLVCAFMAVSLLRRWIRSLRHISLFQPLLGALLAGVFRKAATHVMRGLPAEKRDRLAAVAGIIKGKKRVYGPVFYWPAFIIIQIAGIGFNLGVLAGSIVRIVSLDLAFGWQSTIQFSSWAVYMFVKTVALPWSWIVSPTIAHPTYVQIEGSRMVLKDGIYQLATPDLVSWWPFLFLAVLCYGFLPRLILFSVGIMARKRAANKVDFNHVACSGLLRRLTTPVLETDGRTMANNDNSAPPADEPGDELQPDAGKAAVPWHDATVLVPDDISGQHTNEALEVLLKKRLGMDFKRMIEIAFDVEQDERALSALTGSRPLTDLDPVVVLQEAWQPPIAETLLYFRKLRELLGTETQIHIFLVGKPTPETFLTSAGPADWKIWKQAIQMLGDPFIEIHGLRNS